MKRPSLVGSRALGLAIAAFVLTGQGISEVLAEVAVPDGYVAEVFAVNLGGVEDFGFDDDDVPWVGAGSQGTVVRSEFKETTRLSIDGSGLLAQPSTTTGQATFDLTHVAVSTAVNSATNHGIAVHGGVFPPSSFQRVLIRNPLGELIADSEVSEFLGTPDAFLLWSGTSDAVFPGIYEVEVHYTDMTSDLRRVDVPAHLFSSALPTGFAVVGWWPAPNGVLQPTFGWDPFQSPEFDPANEYLEYSVEVGCCDLSIWIGNVPADTTETDYNFDGSAAAGYETLPPGAYIAFLGATESQDYPSFSLDVGDEYGTARSSLSGIDFDVACAVDEHCNDGVFCNGIESCDTETGTCVAVSSCPPSVEGCLIINGDCDEENDECLDVLDDSLCEPEEVCMPDGECVPVSDPCADDDGDGKVTICHIPPGNPDNAHTITVSINALPAHLAHGDACGPCAGDGELPAGNAAIVINVEFGQCFVLDGIGDLVAGEGIVVITNNPHGDIIAKCRVQGVENPAGQAVHWNYANTGFQCVLDLGDGPQISTNWHETVSASGNAMVTCRIP